MSAATLFFLRFTFACSVALISLVGGRAIAQVSPLVDVQVYENSTVFPGEFRYFMTARAADKAYLVANPHMGWTPLYSFSAFAVDSAPPGAVPVCRFYLPTLATHFYTAQPAECAQFKRDPLFLFEGNDFYATLPSTANAQTAACAASDAPVYRAYNEGARRNVSGNHIFGTDIGLASYLAINSGWRYEGVVMCLPKAPEFVKAVVVAGRASADPPFAWTHVEPAGMPIVQVLDPVSLTSKTYVDPIRGESDWQNKAGFDAIRGKAYLVRATTMHLRDYSATIPPTDSASLLVVDPIRNTENVIEIDVATGDARYLNVGGTYTEAHFNQRTRLLLLTGMDSFGVGQLTWFDPAKNIVVATQSLAVPAVHISLKFIGSLSCEYVVFTNTTRIHPMSAGDAYLYTATDIVSTGQFCVSAGRAIRAASDIEADISWTAVKSGNDIFAVRDGQRGRASELVRYSVSDLSLVESLTQAQPSVPPPLYDSGDYRILNFVASGGDLLAVLQKLYLTGDIRQDFGNYRYYVLRYRGDELVDMKGPLATTSNELWGGPKALIGQMTRSVPRRTAVPATELWTLTRSGQNPKSIVRADATTYQGIGEITLDVPGAQLHLQ